MLDVNITVYRGGVRRRSRGARRRGSRSSARPQQGGDAKLRQIERLLVAEAAEGAEFRRRFPDLLRDELEPPSHIEGTRC